MITFTSTPTYGPYFLDKRTLLLVDSTFNLVQFTNGPYEYQVVGLDFDISIHRAYYASIGLNKAAQFYYISFENCTSRTGGICTACSAGTYLSNTSAQNECLEPDQLPLGYGLNIPLSTIQACQLSNCKYCQSNYQSCQGCNDALGLYYLPATSTCVDLTNLPDGFGPNISSRAIVPCLYSSATCLRCDTNYANCSKCQTSPPYYHV